MLKITESNVTIMISDMETSVKFYESIGFTMKQRWDNHYAMLTAEGITIGLHPGADPAKRGTNISIGLMVEKADDAAKHLEEKGIKAERVYDENSGIYLHFTDPDGNIIYFNEPNWK